MNEIPKMKEIEGTWFEGKQLGNGLNKWYQGGLKLSKRLVSKALVDCNDIWNKYNISPDEFKNKRVLDLGCNAGFFCFKAIENGAKETLGIELQKDYVEIANHLKKENNITNANFINGNVELELEKHGKFDAVFVNRFIYYVNQGKDFLKKICDLTNDTLYLFTLIWTHPNPKNVGLPFDSGGVDWRYVPTFDELKKDLKEFGFEIVHISALHETDLKDVGIIGEPPKENRNRRIIFKAKRRK